MPTLDEVLDLAKRLSGRDRRRLVEELEQGLAADEPDVPEATRLAAMERWLALAGTGHSDYTDVSTDKYRHLGAEAWRTWLARGPDGPIEDDDPSRP